MRSIRGLLASGSSRAPSRSWLVIPALGVVAAGAAVGLHAVPTDAIAAGLAGAGLAGAIRTLAGDSAAAITAAAIAPLLAIASLFDHGGALAIPCLALAAAGWTFAELGREVRSPMVALVPATIAAVLEPGMAALVAIAGVRVASRRWAAGPETPPATSTPIIVVVGGGLAIGLAVLAGVARHGTLGALGAHWFGTGPAPIAPGLLATRLAAALGPVTAVAALAGMARLAHGVATSARRGRHAAPPRLAELAIASCVAGAVLVDLRAGTIGPVTPGIAALCAGLALDRFAALVRLRSGQALVGATAGLLLLVPPAWTVIEHGRRIANVHASR